MSLEWNISDRLTVTKPAVSGTRGIVAAQHKLAAHAGAQVLAQGGDCVDALIATSFALGVVEPWMSGMGGGGAMVLYRARDKKFEVIDFGMRAPQGLNPADYPLSGEGAASDLFPWPRVVNDRNLYGAGAVAVPGVVAGMAAAFERYATRPWAELLQPAIALCERGLLVDGPTTEAIAGAALDLRRNPAAASLYLADGLPPTPHWGIRDRQWLKNPALLASLRTLAQDGPRALRDGALARALAADVAAAGGALRLDDLAQFEARLLEPLSIAYRNARVYATPELTAGPTLAHALSLMQAALDPAQPLDAAYAGTARALQAAYRARLNDMGDADGRRAIGAEHRAPACTTHCCVIDAEGNMASVTQTLLSIFGAKFVSPSTGILLNNGIMWFDPEPGRANSLAPGKRCLTNYCPVIAERDDGVRIAVGASGGRRILPAVTQLLSFTLDFRMDLESAMHAPRIDASEGEIVIADPRIASDTLEQLRQQFTLEEAPLTTTPMKFACPSAVMSVDAKATGAVSPAHPWAEAVAVAA